MTTSFTFKHDAEAMHTALGYTQKEEIKALEIILFSAFSNHFIAKELFDDIESVPRCLNTASGDLEKSLSLVETEKERDIVLLNFYKTHDIALSCIGEYGAILKMNEKDKLKAELLLKIVDMKFQQEVDDRGNLENHKSKYLSPTSVFKRIEIVKNSRFNFSKYMSLLEEAKLTM